MLLTRFKTALIVCFASVGFALGNLWFTAQRSTIPIELDAQLVHRDISYEKHAGVDDVYWLVFESGKKIHVDKLVFEAVQKDEYLKKAAFSKQLQHGQETLQLTWSPDFVGMLKVMPLLTILMISLCALVKKFDAS